MSQAVYSCDALRGTGKSGILVPDKDGYYDCVIGAFDYCNSKNIFYDFGAVKEIFEASSDLMRRIQRGVLHGECGHPRRRPGESEAEFFHRCLDIYEPNISHHFREVWIDRDSIKTPDGRPIVSVRSWLKPAGVCGPALEKAMGNGPQNVCFSVRSFADEKRKGMSVTRLIRILVTWDWVMEGGVDIASKYMSPAMESLESDIYITDYMLSEIGRIENSMGKRAFESGAVAAAELIRSMTRTNIVGGVRPGSTRW